MFNASRICTSYGPRLIEHPQRLTIPTSPIAALAFASLVDRQADIALAEGRFVAAERLSHCALEARLRAAEARP